ncbi:MAG TPA: hypothetical protein VGK74_14325 [Symbiobacteriaceae bacterium]
MRRTDLAAELRRRSEAHAAVLAQLTDRLDGLRMARAEQETYCKLLRDEIGDLAAAKNRLVAETAERIAWRQTAAAGHGAPEPAQLSASLHALRTARDRARETQRHILAQLVALIDPYLVPEQHETHEHSREKGESHVSAS